MLRPEDAAPKPEQEHQSQGIGAFVKNIFGGGGGDKQEDSQKGTTAESQSTAARIAKESKESRGSVTTSSSHSEVQSTNTYKADTKESDEKWDEARAFTAKAQEQSRQVLIKEKLAAATQRESAEAMRRAEIARGADQDLQARIREVYPDDLDSDYKDVGEKLEHAKGAAAAKRAEMERLEREMASLNDEVNRKTAVLQGEVDSTKAAQHEVDNFSAKIDRLRDAITYEEAQAIDNCKDVEKFQKDAVDARAAAKGQKGIVNAAQASGKDLQRQLEEAKRNAESARRKLAKYEHEAEDAESTLSDREKTAKHHALEAESYKSKISELEKCKAEALDRLKKSQSKLEGATKDTEAKSGILKERESLTSSLKETLSKIQQQERAKMEELAHAKAEHDKAEADLKPLKAERERQRRIMTSEVEQAKELEEKFKSFRIEADRAQARKKEMWAKAYSAGEVADNIVDEKFMKLGGDKELTSQGEKTKQVASQIKETTTKSTEKSSSVSAHEIKTKVEK